MGEGIANPEGLRRDNDLQLPAVLFSILDKSKGNEEKGKRRVGGEEGDIRKEEENKWRKKGVKSQRSSEEGGGDKEGEELAEERRYNFIHLIPSEQKLLLPGLHLVLRAPR